MTKTKHTPGPWVYGDEMFDSQITAPSAPAAWGNRTIAVVDHAEDEMGEANAHLIAAAPELLAAVEDAYRAASAMGWSDKMLLWGAAIARARGGGENA